VITIDDDKVIIDEHGLTKEYNISSKEAFNIISKLWLRSGWDTKYVYSFTWLGRPIIQLPEDIIRVQEVIYRVRPDVIIETGIAHGGSLVFYAGLLKTMGGGRVIGVDIEIRSHNREAIEAHEMFEYITLVEGSSIDPQIIEVVNSMVKDGEKVFVILDSNHTREHVLAELQGYGNLVSVGSYIVATDGIMGDLVGAPRSESDWFWNNPKEAAKEFVNNNNKFVIEEPIFSFNEGIIKERVTYWPSSFLRKIC
jgi:cephalosporin hydroxylase